MSLVYRREIDGLRAVAVIPVVLFHAHATIFGGGFVGVDVFFVISGYLISSILFDQHDAGCFTFRNFYERRARRILPALYLMVTVTSLVAIIVMTPDQLEQFTDSVLATLVFGSNFYFWQQNGYFGQAAENLPLLHTWSLAVEEQFYIAFPVALVFLWKSERLIRHLLWIVGLACVAGLAFSLWVHSVSPRASFYLAPMRAWQLLAGIFVAALLHRQSRPCLSHGALAWSGLGMIVAAMLIYDRDSPYPGFRALLPTIGTALVILFASGQNQVGRLLGMRWLVGVGLISYSFYLWHVPLFVYARLYGYGESDLPLFLFLSLVAAAIAGLSWRFIETPCRSAGRFNIRRLVSLSLGVPVLFAPAMVLAAGHVNQKLWGDEALKMLDIRDYYEGHPYRCFLMRKMSPDDFGEQCMAAEHPQWILWGDSHAASLYPGLAQRFGQSEHWQVTLAGCPPIHDFDSVWQASCRANNIALFPRLRGAQADYVILAASWYAYRKSPEWGERLEATIADLRAAGSQVIVIGSLPRWSPGLPVKLARIVRHAGRDHLPRRMTASDQDELRQIDQTLAALSQRTGAAFLSVVDVVCNTEFACDAMTADGMPTSWDYAHLTEGGADQLAGLLGPGLLSVGLPKNAKQLNKP